MNAQQLRNSILQEAIHGRLVPQDPADEPASVLLQRIRKEKERLVKEGKLKKKDLESKPIVDDEIPFVIPKVWEWVRLGEICEYIHRGKSPKYGTSKKLPIIAQKCNQWDKVYTDKCLFAEEKTIERYTEEQYIKLGDIIINSTGTGTVGRTGFIDGYVFADYSKFVADSHVTVVRATGLIDRKFLYYYLISPFIQFGLEDRCSGSTNQIELGTGTIFNYKVPLPPLPEQHRIVAKIEELLPLVEQYGKAQAELDDLNRSLPDKLKKSVLQEAIQGRLVPQNANDEPASELLKRIRKEKERLVKEGKLKKKDMESKPIENDEIPFEIPKGWEWVRLGEICEYIHRGKSPKYGTSKKLPIIAQKCNQWDKVYTDKCLFAEEKTIERYTEEQYIKLGDIIINSTGTGTVGRTGYIDGYVFADYSKYVADSHVTVVRSTGLIARKFLYYYLISPFIQFGLEDRCSGSTNQIELGTSTISNYKVPIPPLSEQRRIVAKIEELFKKIDGLKG